MRYQIRLHLDDVFGRLQRLLTKQPPCRSCQRTSASSATIFCSPTRPTPIIPDYPTWPGDQYSSLYLALSPTVRCHRTSARPGRESGNRTAVLTPFHPAHVQSASATHTYPGTKFSSNLGSLKAALTRTSVLLLPHPHPHLSGPDSVGSSSFSPFALCPSKMEPNPQPPPAASRLP